MTQKTSDQLLESLSALVDGEASELELRRIVKTMDDDNDLQKKWSRFNLVGQIMRSEAIVQPQLDLSESIRSALESDDSFSSAAAFAGSNQPVAESKPQWKLWLGKTSVAASVAVAFVFGFAQLNSGSIGAGDTGAVVASSGTEAGSGSINTPAKNSVSATENPANPANQSSVASAAQPANGTLAAPLGFELPGLGGRTVGMAGSQGDSSHSALRGASVSDGFTNAQSQQLLNQLHIQHAQRASLNSGLGILPFARIPKMGPESVAPEAQKSAAR